MPCAIEVIRFNKMKLELGQRKEVVGDCVVSPEGPVHHCQRPLPMVGRMTDRSTTHLVAYLQIKSTTLKFTHITIVHRPNTLQHNSSTSQQFINLPKSHPPVNHYFTYQQFIHLSTIHPPTNHSSTCQPFTYLLTIPTPTSISSGTNNTDFIDHVYKPIRRQFIPHLIRNSFIYQPLADATLSWRHISSVHNT